MTAAPLKAPFPYFGGKAMIAADVWEALGQTEHYLEPFFGSGAVLLARPGYDPARHTETVCDADGHLCNVWRAMRQDPHGLARVCDWPVNHADLNARRRVLNARLPELLPHLVEDDKFYDLEMAGYWVWAASCWIGSGLTCPNGRPHISDKGNGIHKASVAEIAESDDPRASYTPGIYAWFRRLSDRLRRVRVVCGDWTRILGGDWQDNKWPTVGIFFDPPYSAEAGRDPAIYAQEDLAVAHHVRAWAVERGARPNYRIVLAGYEGEHDELDRIGWRVKEWTASGGYGKLARADDAERRGMANRKRERLWLSPHCLTSVQGRLI